MRVGGKRSYALPALLLVALALPAIGDDGTKRPLHRLRPAAKADPPARGPEYVADRTAGETPPAPAAAPATPPAAIGSSAAAAATSTAPTEAKPGEHPLMPALRWAKEGVGNVEKISDYSATLVMRERVDGKLGDHEYLFLKVRHKPFSVYIYFLSPANLKGQEVIFVDGQNDGKMWAHTTGLTHRMVGAVSLLPTGPIAMKNRRYPITETGILNLINRLVEVAEQDTKYGECEVKFLKDAKINDRTCTCIQVVHPVPRRNFRFHLARVYVDDELNLPIRYEAYDWPAEKGGEPELMEEYTYLKLKLNNGFTDADFDMKNPKYGFEKR